MANQMYALPPLPLHDSRLTPSVLQADPKEKANCHFCQLRSFATHSTIPISLINNLNEEEFPTESQAVLNPKFRFIDHSVVTPGVPVADAQFRSGCDCEEDGECMYSTCHCLDEVADSDDDDDQDYVRGKRKKRFAYHSGGPKAELLRSRVLEGSEPIYECNDGCNCSLRCPNRVVQRGRTVPLQIFRTEDRGWGVRCPVPLRKGQFVDRYVGEVITNDEANRRREESSLAQRKDVYLFGLDKFSNPESLDELLSGPPLEVDGEYMSGPTRFINHSCEPNLRIFARVGDHVDKYIHDLALFAICDIPQNQELTFDYVPDFGKMELDSHDPLKTKDMTKCLCGTKKCRGFLW